MNTSLTLTTLSQVGQAANAYAAKSVFADYRARTAAHTLRRQANDLTLFARYLAAAGVVVQPENLLSRPDAWHGITYGLVDGFVRWMLAEGYAIGSVNVRLATVKAYAKLVAKAGVLSASEYALITLVTGYKHAEGRNLDQQRETSRKGSKKAVAASISSAQATLLKAQPETPQGRRDAFLLCLLLDHGLRCGEVEALTVEAINLEEGTLTFYREKVDKTQTHRLTPDTLAAAKRYLETCAPVSQLLVGSRKGGVIQGVMSTRAITERVRYLGERLGLEGLNAHDCRHYWATAAIRGGSDIRSLQDAGGWSSPAMPLRYAEAGRVANEGVTLG